MSIPAGTIVEVKPCVGGWSASWGSINSGERGTVLGLNGTVDGCYVVKFLEGICSFHAGNFVVVQTPHQYDVGRKVKRLLQL